MCFATKKKVLTMSVCTVKFLIRFHKYVMACLVPYIKDSLNPYSLAQIDFLSLNHYSVNLKIKKKKKKKDS